MFTLYYHPLASFCQKVIVGLYELDVPFEKRFVDLMDPAGRAAFAKIWPLAKFPVLRDDARGLTIPETTIILEHVEGVTRGNRDLASARTRSLFPADPDRARDARLRDRFFDLYVSTPLGKIVTDNLRPEGGRDPLGVEEARATLETAYAIADDWLREGPWAAGETFSIADCAAAPALFYALQVVPAERHPHVRSYFARVSERPSWKRVLEEAKPYLPNFEKTAGVDAARERPVSA